MTALSPRDHAQFYAPTTPAAAPAIAGNQPRVRIIVDDAASDDELLGQFIPIHYHYQMLDQQARTGGFEQAIDHVVKPGMKVLELGAGTGVLSFFAARAGATKVYSVERLPHVAKAARGFIDANGFGHVVDIIDGDAMTYLPPEPVDVVICEMLHGAMLREKQLAVITSFKERYLARFGGPLPRFLPEAAVLAVQPLMTNYQFHGYQAPVPMFVDSTNAHRATNLATPALYAVFPYEDPFPTQFDVDQAFVIEQAGTLNSLRFITKNLLAMVTDQGRSIDWDMMDLVIPFASPVEVEAGDVVHVRFRYNAGDSLLALAEAIDRDETP
jgi:predicted RNA methylase